MASTAQLRNAYAKDTVSTASPARLVVMLYDRFLKDLNQAEQAVVAHQVEQAHNALIHAEEIVTELLNTLDTSTWKDGEGLQRLYVWVLEQLIEANATKQVQPIHDARDVMEPLRDAWVEVADHPEVGA